MHGQRVAPLSTGRIFVNGSNFATRPNISSILIKESVNQLLSKMQDINEWKNRYDAVLYLESAAVQEPERYEWGATPHGPP